MKNRYNDAQLFNSHGQNYTRKVWDNMKSVAVAALVLWLLATLAVKAQSAKPTIETSAISNAERFTQKSGALIQKSFLKVGTIKECEIQVASFTDLMSGQKSSAVRFEYTYSGSHLALLDADELDGLIKSIKIIQSKIIGTAPTEYTEVSYTSRSGFQVGCYFEENKKKWSPFIKLERYDSKSYVFINNDDLAPLLSILENAKLKLTT